MELHESEFGQLEDGQQLCPVALFTCYSHDVGHIYHILQLESDWIHHDEGVEQALHHRGIFQSRVVYSMLSIWKDNVQGRCVHYT